MAATAIVCRRIGEKNIKGARETAVQGNFMGLSQVAN